MRGPSKHHLDREVQLRGRNILGLSIALVILHHVSAGPDVCEHALELVGELIATLALQLDQHIPLCVI